MILFLLALVTVFILYYFFLPDKKFMHREEFDCYVINLERNKDRMENVQRTYDRSDLNTQPLIRVEAVDGKKIDIEPFITPLAYEGILQMEKTNERLYHAQISRGAVGCYLSHLNIYEQIQQSGKEFGIILEDDVSIPKHVFKQRIRDVLNTVPEDWDMILLGSIQHKSITMDKCVQVLDFWGTWSYMINLKGIEAMQKHGNIPIEEQIDKVMTNMVAKGQFKIYAPKRNIIETPTLFGTDIQISITPKEGVNPFEYKNVVE